jgi:hypothetical protein
MKTVFLALLVSFVPSIIFAGDVRVKGYTKRDGTYVAPHTRSEPNAYQWDNKSYTPSQPAYNDSYSKPTKSYGSDWYKPSDTRYQDNNPYNNNPPANPYGSYDWNK